MTYNDTQFDNVLFDFKKTLSDYKINIIPEKIETIQCNITYCCNQSCKHCHIQAGPNRTEMMNRKVIDKCLEILACHEEIKILDLTGGSPELNPDFKYFVSEALKLKKKVIVRHNLTVAIDGNPLTKESLEYLPEFFAKNKVEIVSSLPYFQLFFTDKQRGKGVFNKSIIILKRLNSVGYGKEGTGLILNLVYNPAGAFLPSDQSGLEKLFKEQLYKNYGIVFNSLFTITNMPIFKFRDELIKIDSLNNYYRKLHDAFNPTAANGVMCKYQISIDHAGNLFDCDFNQVIGMQIDQNEPMTVFNFDYDELINRDIQLAPHCFGCTAGSGSSCGGATT